MMNEAPTKTTDTDLEATYSASVVLVDAVEPGAEEAEHTPILEAEDLQAERDFEEPDEVADGSEQEEPVEVEDVPEKPDDRKEQDLLVELEDLQENVEEPDPPEREHLANVEDIKDEEVKDDPGEVEGLSEEEEGVAEGGLEDDQFIVTRRGFARIRDFDESVRQGSPQDSTDREGKPVRWAHRAYRGDIEVTSTKSPGGATTLVVFGDGLLLIESSGLTSGRVGGFVSALAGGRPARKLLGTASSSAVGQARVKGSRRIAASDIGIVRIEKGGVFYREVTIRTTVGEELQYRLASKRHRQFVELLSPLLGPRLQDMSQADKKPKRAG